MSKEGATTSLVLHSTVALDKASYHHHLNYSGWNILQNLPFFETMLEDNYKFRKGVANFKDEIQ